MSFSYVVPLLLLCCIVLPFPLLFPVRVRLVSFNCTDKIPCATSLTCGGRSEITLQCFVFLPAVPGPLDRPDAEPVFRPVDTVHLVHDHVEISREGETRILRIC